MGPDPHGSRPARGRGVGAQARQARHPSAAETFALTANSRQPVRHFTQILSPAAQAAAWMAATARPLESRPPPCPPPPDRPHRRLSPLLLAVAAVPTPRQGLTAKAAASWRRRAQGPPQLRPARACAAPAAAGPRRGWDCREELRLGPRLRRLLSSSVGASRGRMRDSRRSDGVRLPRHPMPAQLRATRQP